MIGQQANITLVSRLLREQRLPHFIIVHGAQYSGKHMLVAELVELIGKTASEVGRGIDEIREMINDIYSSQHDRVYTLFHLEKCNYKAIESILKICEEPPAYSYLIVTVDNLDFLKATIKNRAFILNMLNYTYSEMQEYIKASGHSYELTEFGYNLIKTPSLFKYFVVDKNIDKYKDFFKRFDKIMDITPTNALRAVEYFNLKDGENDKIDFWLYLDWLAVLLAKYSIDNEVDVVSLSVIILRFKENQRVMGINMPAIVNTFIILFRKHARKHGLAFEGVFSKYLEEL